MSKEVKMGRGFELLRKANNLAVEFHLSGYEGEISFAKACIWSGITRAEEIVAKACAIGGDHLYNRFSILLMEGENIHWFKYDNDELGLLT